MPSKDGGGGGYKNTRHSREIPWQPCEEESTRQVVINQCCHDEGTSGRYLTNPIPTCMRDGKGWPGLLEAWLVLTRVKYHGNL